MLRLLATHWRKASGAAAASVTAAAAYAHASETRSISFADSASFVHLALESEGVNGSAGPGVPPPPTRLVLAGDCGGTNTRLHLYSVPDDARPQIGCKAPGELILCKRFVNSDYESFSQVVTAFLEEAMGSTVGGAVEVCAALRLNEASPIQTRTLYPGKPSRTRLVHPLYARCAA
ncbi:hypothetical protein T492DRAFT_40822 [Pavlovales sp. CCMP2436]|nr:hypothetical protein T492DRAFT_40822 [Pavlovales sp. CCMP2436]